MITSGSAYIAASSARAAGSMAPVDGDAGAAGPAGDPHATPITAGTSTETTSRGKSWRMLTGLRYHIEASPGAAAAHDLDAECIRRRPRDPHRCRADRASLYVVSPSPCTRLHWVKKSVQDRKWIARRPAATHRTSVIAASARIENRSSRCT